MKKMIISLAIATLFFASCNNSTKKNVPPPPPEKARIIAIYTDSAGNKTPLVAFRQIKREAVYDSIKGDWKVSIDTAWAIEKNLPLADSLGRPMLDSAGKKVYGPFWVLVHKNSINTHVENVPFDSLTKSDKINIKDSLKP